ncbi:hypothetical protein BANRA_05513 [Klebsiella pneumoniae]|nr:hypothetical protein BANRA_05513 [Klebsiella pneumoniae]
MKVRRNRTQAIMDAVGKMKKPCSSDGVVIPVDANAIWQMVLAVCKADFPCNLNYFYSKELRTENNA